VPHVILFFRRAVDHTAQHDRGLVKRVERLEAFASEQLTKEQFITTGRKYVRRDPLISEARAHDLTERLHLLFWDPSPEKAASASLKSDPPAIR